MKKKIFVYLFDGYSDWEIAYFSPEINKHKDFELIYFSNDGKTVTSMGGLKAQPKIALDKINAKDIDLLILPGGEAWEQGKNQEITNIVTTLLQLQKPISAICAATTYLGNLGILDHVKHTSNDLNYLKAVAPTYKGEQHYQNTFAVTDQQIITANGIAPIEFAREIFKTIQLFEEDYIEKWFQLFKNGIWQE